MVRFNYILFQSYWSPTSATHIQGDSEKNLKKNEKLRNTLVTVHIDCMHMCIQVTKVVFWFLCTCAYYKLLVSTCAYYKLLVSTCAYRLVGRLPWCSSVFNPLLAVFPWTPLSLSLSLYIYIYIFIIQTHCSISALLERDRKRT